MGCAVPSQILNINWHKYNCRQTYILTLELATVWDLYLKIIDVRNYGHHQASLGHPCLASIWLFLVVPCENENKSFLIRKLLFSISIKHITENNSQLALSLWNLNNIFARWRSSVPEKMVIFCQAGKVLKCCKKTSCTMNVFSYQVVWSFPPACNLDVFRLHICIQM